MFFNINEVLRLPSGNFACNYVASSRQDAEMVVAQFLGPVRMNFGFSVELYADGCTVYVAAPSPDVAKTVAQVLNNSIIKTIQL